MQAMVAYTNEIDDVELAVSEILEQLNFEDKLLKNTVGILSCFAEYIDTGVVQALCEKLPFPVTGTTTVANSVSGVLGEMMLCLMVLTSEDVSFRLALSEPITEEDEKPLRECYEAAAQLPGQPAFMFSFAPLLPNVGNDFYVESMSAISGNVPNFGPLAVDHNPDYHASNVILNGESWRDRYVILLAYGDKRPAFYVGSISAEKVFREKGVVTAAKGNQLQTVNGVSVIEYLESLGLKKNEDGTITGINSFPIIVDYNDGTRPVARAMFALTPEGHAVCGGNIPVGATLSVGSFDAEEIVATTCRTLEEALQSGKHSVILMYSCIGRYFAQGYNQMAELEQVQARIDAAGLPYLAAYSGGEICPVYDNEGKTVNRNHNNTFIMCAF